MFTGIVERMGVVVRADRNDFGMRMLIDPGSQWKHGCRHGDSVAVNGCCLTHAPAADDPPRTLAFDLIRETLDKTNLGRAAVGSRLNLEPSLTPASLMAGHFVQGHVDGVGDVVGVVSDPTQWRTTVRPPAALMRYMVPKGSVTIDGVSLTLAAVDAAAGTIDVALIPTTLEITTLGTTKVGDTVNLEADVIAKTIVHWLEHYVPTAASGPGSDARAASGGVTLDLLRSAGFAE